MVQTVPSTAIYMLTYEAITTEIKHISLLNNIYPAIAGACARTLTVSILAPIELIRTRQSGGIQGIYIEFISKYY